MVDPGEVGNEPHFRWLLHCSRAGQGSAVQDGCNAALQQLPSCSAVQHGSHRSIQQGSSCHPALRQLPTCSAVQHGSHRSIQHFAAKE